MTAEERKAWGRELRRRREEAGYTPDEFARMIGLASRTLQGVELGTQKMGEASMMRAEAALAGRKLPGMHEIGEEATPYQACSARASLVREVARVVSAPGWAEKVSGVASLLGIDPTEAAYIALTQELKKNADT